MDTRAIRRLVGELLRLWELPAPEDPCLEQGEGLALMANLANWSAKVVDQEWYDYKPGLVARALVECQNTWLAQGVVYVETPVGQVSFHVFPEELDWENMDPGREAQPWCGYSTQEQAPDLVRAFLSLQ